MDTKKGLGLAEEQGHVHAEEQGHDFAKGHIKFEI